MNGYNRDVRAACALLAATTLITVACGASERVDEGELQRVRAASDRPLYYLGESFEGLPLTHADATGRGGSFIYGTCEPSGSDSGCAPPLQVQNWTLAARHPSKFELTPGERAPCKRLTVRGVPAAIFTTSGGALEVYAGTTVAVIFGEPRQVRRAALALRPLGSARPRRPLPAPPPSVGRALRRCALESRGAKLRELRRTARAPFYWVGRVFAGHPLARVEGTGRTARFVYGKCAQRQDYDSDAGCWAPLELLDRPVAGHNPSRYAPAIRCRRTRIRGVPVVVVASAHTVEVFTGGTTVTMYAKRISLMVRAARALRTVHQERPSPAPLPPPPQAIAAAVRARCSPLP